MPINVSHDVIWYVRDFQNIWHDKYERSSILSFDYETISNILSSVHLNVKNEYFVWKAIYDWINFDKNRRLEHLPDLIENCLRFGCLDKHFIDSFIFECDLFTALPDAIQCGLKDFINNGLRTCQQSTAFSFNLNNLLNVCHFFPRFTEPILVCILNDNGHVGFYNNNYKCWHSLPMSLKFQRQTHYQLALLGRKLYAFGGKDNTYKSLNLMWSRDLSDPSSQWRARADMKQSRMEFHSVVLNDTIYALGGKDTNDDPLRSCERYNSQLNEWSTVADMNSGRNGASTAVINGCIYVAGGWNRGVLKSVCKYCPETDTWREVAPMTTGRWDFALTPFAGRLWAIGGRGHGTLSSCESYDPVTNTWREEAPMKRRRYKHTAIEFNGELYVVGGSRDEDSTKIEKYEPNFKKWVIDRTYTQNIMYTPQLLIIPPICSSFFTTDPNQ